MNCSVSRSYIFFKNEQNLALKSDNIRWRAWLCVLFIPIPLYTVAFLIKQWTIILFTYMSMMIAMFIFSRGEQCSENRFTGDCLWRYSWSVLWSQRIVQSRRRCSWHKLPVHGRLRWSRILQRRDFPPSARPESSISWQNLPDQRKSRVPTNYAGRDENGIF